MNDTSIGLSAWRTRMIALLGRFEYLYREAEKRDPGQYPLDMSDEEWSEQFDLWDGEDF